MKKNNIFLVLSLIIYSTSGFCEISAAPVELSGSWSPYVAGSLIGLLVCLTLYFSDEPVGASSVYATVAGFIGNIIAPNHTKKLEYYKENPPKVNWEFVFVLAAILGSAIAALHGREFSIKGLPEMWTQKYGSHSWILFTSLSFLGGVLMAFGSRLAGGCTSGHGISGTAQLSVSSWISVICFFIGGVLAIHLIY